MSDAFAAPANASGITWKDLNGSLLLFRSHSLESGIKTIHGESQAVRADVIVLDGDRAGTVYNDTLVFPKVLIANVKPPVGSTGHMVLGRLGQGQAKTGQSAPWILTDATEADKDVARAYLAKATPPPF